MSHSFHKINSTIHKSIFEFVTFLKWFAFMNSENTIIKIKVGREIVFLNTNEILYIEANNIYCKIHLIMNKIIVCTESLKEIESQLKTPNFYKTHRSFIINTKFIERFIRSKLSVYIKSIDEPIQISRNKRDEFEKKFVYNQ
ncbi:MAG: response regulator transcription factor [Bacteroidetes bacterium]|nr:response regulator transcription factor [Bacteroidota bacterium]